MTAYRTYVYLLAMLLMATVCNTVKAQDSKGLKIDQANAGEAPAGKTYALIFGIFTTKIVLISDRL